MRFKKFVPRAEQDDQSNSGLNYGDDFSFCPQKFFCRQHHSNEIEFICEINNEFYCKKC